MNTVNIHEVRENLAEYLAAAERGEEVLICRRNQPVARLVAIDAPPAQRRPRPIGRAADAGVALPAAFFDPLPDEMLAALAGAAGPAHDPLGAVAPSPRPSAPAASRANAAGVANFAKTAAKAAAPKPAAGKKRGSAPRR